MQPNLPGRPPRTALHCAGIAGLAGLAGLAVLFLTLLPLAASAQATSLGATIVGSSVQFALFSANATRVEVWIFATPTASTPTAKYALTQTDMVNHIWTVTVSGLGAGALYGYRVWGPN